MSFAAQSAAWAEVATENATQQRSALLLDQLDLGCSKKPRPIAREDDLDVGLAKPSATDRSFARK
jgi:hypothetical protein